jgi:hypothetical protein
MRACANIIQTLIATSVFASGIAIAEVSLHDSKTAPDSMGSALTKALDKKNPEKLKTMYGKDQFRCWQYGDLIVDERDWKLSQSGKAGLLKKNGKNLYTFDYGETFCMYVQG